MYLGTTVCPFSHSKWRQRALREIRALQTLTRDPQAAPSSPSFFFFCHIFRQGFPV